MVLADFFDSRCKEGHFRENPTHERLDTEGTRGGRRREGRREGRRKGRKEGGGERGEERGEKRGERRPEGRWKEREGRTKERREGLGTCVKRGLFLCRKMSLLDNLGNAGQ